MSQYFPPYRIHRGDIKVELDLRKFATKTVTHVDVSSSVSKTSLASLKTEIDKIDADKLKTVPVDLAKLSDVVKSDVVKKTECNTLKTKVDSARIAVKNKIPDVSSLVKKTDYNTKISEIENKVNDHNHDKYISTQKFNTMAADVSKARLAAQTDLIRKPDFDSKLKGISDRVTKNKTKYFLVENELKNYKNLMLLILEAKVILKKMEHKIINGLGKNCIIFGADLSSSSHANNQKNSILVLGKDFVQRINGTTFYAGKLSKISFTEKNKTFCLSLHCNGANSYLFVNGTEVHKFKAKDSKIVASPLCLGNISKDFSVDNMKKNRIKWLCL